MNAESRWKSDPGDDSDGERVSGVDGVDDDGRAGTVVEGDQVVSGGGLHGSSLASDTSAR
jgi:hypothetical protein